MEAENTEPLTRPDPGATGAPAGLRQILSGLGAESPRATGLMRAERCSSITGGLCLGRGSGGPGVRGFGSCPGSSSPRVEPWLTPAGVLSSSSALSSRA